MNFNNNPNINPNINPNNNNNPYNQQNQLNQQLEGPPQNDLELLFGGPTQPQPQTHQQSQPLSEQFAFIRAQLAEPLRPRFTELAYLLHNGQLSTQDMSAAMSNLMAQNNMLQNRAQQPMQNTRHLQNNASFMAANPMAMASNAMGSNAMAQNGMANPNAMGNLNLMGNPNQMALNFNMLGGSAPVGRGPSNANANPNSNPNSNPNTRRGPNSTDQPPMKRMRNDTKPTAPPSTSAKPPASASVPTQRTLTVPSGPSQSQPQPSQSFGQKPEVDLDIDDMMDVTNYAGVDLKEEEFSMNEWGGAYTGERYKEIPFLNPYSVEETAIELGVGLGIEEVDDSFTSFMSQAAEVYITTLLEKMCAAAECRANLDYDVFQSNEWDVEARDDIRAQLVEMETRERTELTRLIADIPPRPTEDEEGGVGGDVSQTTQATASTVPAPKKRGAKKEVPEAMKHKLTNQAAMFAVGGTVKSWMLPGASISAPAAPTQPVLNKSTSGSAANASSKSALDKTSGLGRGAQYNMQKRITIKDALLVMESQRHLKTSDILYKWLANIK